MIERLLIATAICFGIGISIGYSAMVNADDVYTNLSWTHDLTLTDGTVITVEDIGGYRVYQSADGVNFTQLIDITDSTVQTHEVVQDLPVAPDAYTFHYAVTAYNTCDLNGDGIYEDCESDYSEVVSKTFLVGSTAPVSPPSGLQGSVRCGHGCVITDIVL